MHLEAQQVCAPGGPAGARTWKPSRCAHLEGQQVRIPGSPAGIHSCWAIGRDGDQGFPLRFCHFFWGGGICINPKGGDKLRAEEAYMDLRIFFTIFLGKVFL